MIGSRTILKAIIFMSLLLSLNLSCTLNFHSKDTPSTTSPDTIAPLTIIPSRLSGVAPLLVHFECATNNDEFHTCDFTWSFDDSHAGRWGTNNKSANTAKGAITAHVFESPGTYVVTVNRKNASGSIETSSVTISVDDPELVYAGDKTTCVNPADDADFSEAPAGSRRISTDDLSIIVKYASAGSRILFKRGGEWTTPGLGDTWPENTEPEHAGPVTLGAYGTGINPDKFGIYENAPRITVTKNTSGTYPETFLITNYKQDWRLMDITFLDPSKTCGVIGGIYRMERQLFFRLRVTGFSVGLGWGHWNDPDGPQINENAVVSCDVSDSYTHSAYLGSERLVLLGNSFKDVQESHVVRVWQAYKGVISNNEFSGSSLGSNTGRHALKMHGPREEELDPVFGWGALRKRTEYVIVSDNLFGSSGPWPVAIGPQDSWKDERLSHIIFERNRYIADFGARSTGGSLDLSQAFLFAARQLTIRNNLIDASNYGGYFTGIKVSSEGLMPAPRDVWIYNNTIYKSGNGTGSGWVGIELGTERDGVQGTIIRNNLVSFPGTPTGATLIKNLGTNSQSNNLLNGAVVFEDPENSSPRSRSFELLPGSTDVIDKGYNIKSVFDDLKGNTRPAGRSNDIGAYESADN